MIIRRETILISPYLKASLYRIKEESFDELNLTQFTLPSGLTPLMGMIRSPAKEGVHREMGREGVLHSSTFHGIHLIFFS